MVGVVVSEIFWGEALLVVVVVVDVDETGTPEVVAVDFHVGKSADWTVGPVIVKENLEEGKMEEVVVSGHGVDAVVFSVGLVLAEESLEVFCSVQ